MYIKTITIHGFKSYRDQVAVDPFSAGHNVVVGRNGSGKSNFFSAIRFVLSDQYSSMSREERMRLLHEGTGKSATISAFVEIVFDNTDGRFPNSLPELRLRRTIGQKKDEYSLDRKSATKAEVHNLLESAGFSESNPYYIVPQGRITHLTNISDKERLNVLKEVAGTKVYEKKRLESVKIMDETDAKREKIRGFLEYIEERLTELEEEKEELKEYQKSDRERRCLEYGLHARELDDVTVTLEQIEDERKSDVHNSNLKRKEFNQREAGIQQLEDDETTAKLALNTTTLSLRQYEAELSDLVKSRTEIECQINDFKSASESGQQKKADKEKELKKLEKRIEKVTTRIEELAESLDARVAEEREAKEALETTQSKLSVLYAKQGRAQQFTTQAARDKYLRDEIASLKAYETTQQKRVNDLTMEVENAKQNLDEVLGKNEEQSQKSEERRDRIRNMSEEVTALKEKADGMQEQRKELWREDAKLGQSVASAKEQLQANERALQGMMDKDTANGLRAVKRYAKQLGLEGVYGPLYELFEVSDRYKQAVEVTAGTSLFHVVVDNDDTASRILDSMNKDRAGRVTFMPLNRLKSHTVNYPRAQDAVPMITKLKFDRAYIMAFEQVFGRTIICDDLTTAAQYTRSHGLNSVTLEGDRVDRKGALTGGYHDIRRSRLDAVKGVRKWQEVFNTDSARHAEVKATLSTLEQQITTTLGQIQVLEAKRKQLLETRNMVASAAAAAARDEEAARQRAGRLERDLNDAEAELRDATAKREGYEEEIQTPMTQRLSDAEIALLEQLSDEVEEQKAALVEASQKRQEVSSERSQLEIELNEGLKRTRFQLRSDIDELEGDAGAGVLQSGEVELRESELKNVLASISDLKEQVKETEARAAELQEQLADIRTKLEEAQAEQLENTRAIMKAQKNAERYLNKRQTLTLRKEEHTNAIRDLGVLPEEAFTKYVAVRPEKIMKKLHKVKESLSKFAHVNKKAFEQYNNFTKQRDDLLKRREELDASAESIQELIQTLDQRKDEAIERTFDQVSKYFEEVFEELVPAGKGELVIQKRQDGFAASRLYDRPVATANWQDDETEESSQSKQGKSEIDNYTGISIKVSFNSKSDEGQKIQQLSGGQKSLVALATVFAIQKCDPAPFYLFDEIDANLDAQYRTAVANMIHKLSANAQFITTTFRSEMLAQADKFYGVYFDKSKVSSVATIEKEEAYQFIENSAAVGGL